MTKLIIFFLGWFIFNSHQLIAQINYNVPVQSWPESFGNHRAVLEVTEEADVVGLDLIWRRHDHNQDDRRFIVVEAASGDTIQNIYRYEVNNEYCRIAFGPVKKAGTYFFYYLPYRPEYKNYSAGNYLHKEESPEKEWVRINGLSGNQSDFSSLPQCKVFEIQARSEFHSFYPMEVIATKDEVRGYLAKHSDPYLVFPEDRSRPIRMLDALPAVWVKEQPSGIFEGIVLRNEYYVFQLGVYASRSFLENVKIEFSDLTTDSGESIAASSITCFNTHGVDINGDTFILKVNVPRGRVQPMWIGIDVDENLKPGIYEGIFTVKPKNQKEKQIKIKLQVLNESLADRGYGELWRHSRLRWLNSTIGIDDEPVRPYTNLKLNQKEISLLGRNIQLDEYGFPIKVSAWKNEILSAPIKFVIEANNKIIHLKPTEFEFTKIKNGVISWKSISENDQLKLTCLGEIEFDGRMHYTCQISAKKDIHLQDIRLEIPYRKEITTYMIGMGRMGGFTPAFHKSRWRKEEDSFWLGNELAGIHCELRGGSYHGPLLNLYQPDHPASWYNGVNGGFRIDTEHETVTATAYSGYRPMQAGEIVNYEFAFIITPVKEFNPNDQFDYRYVHTPHPSEEVVINGGNIINVHHANEYNPFINYPFIANEKLKGLVDKWHEKDWKVKIYYTVRELSNHLTEIWALRSLGVEVLADGPGGGYQWLQEHLVDNYGFQWYTHLGDGVVDAAILNSGESRWYNYYLEGLAWLLKEIDIDGLYLDDFSYDRRILKRVRKIMEEIKPEECHIDVHSNNAFTRGPANQYLEIYPYIDRTWYGEGFNFDLMPADFWFSEVSGVPFGVINELLLHRSVNKGRRGMLYAMVPREDWGMWKFWEEFGIQDSKMIGYWEENCPVKTDNDKVYATTYIKEGQTLVVLGSWLNEPTDVTLDIYWKALGLQEKEAKLYIPEIKNYQKEGAAKIGESIFLDAKGVRFLIISE